MDARPETTITGQLRAATETGPVPVVTHTPSDEEKTTSRRSNIAVTVALILAMVAIALAASL